MEKRSTPIGDFVRVWRERRRLSQLALASDASLSQKHLSFIECGRTIPSRETVMLLAEELEVPLRERNVMLLAAGYAPLFSDRPLVDPAMARALLVIEHILKAHQPWPALCIDQHWNIVRANGALLPLLASVDPELMKPPINVLRISLHPRGLAPLIVNFGEWRAHLLDRLRRQIAISQDADLQKLMSEIVNYPGAAKSPSPLDEIAVPLKLRTQNGVMSFLSTITVFGGPLEITLSELSLEAFYPADEVTATMLDP